MNEKWKVRKRIPENPFAVSVKSKKILLKVSLHSKFVSFYMGKTMYP